VRLKKYLRRAAARSIRQPPRVEKAFRILFAPLSYAVN
jgi:hypothetical protein